MSGKPIFSQITPPLERVELAFLSERSIRLSVLRLDKIHESIHGNKWFKLRQNIEAITSSGSKQVLSFGGAWSNHLQALASAGKTFGFNTIGVIRGELPEQSNPVLDYLRQQGMHLHSVSREQYRHKNDPQFLAELKQLFGDYYHLPEGGSNRLAVAACRDIANYLQWSGEACAQLVSIACGTGATLAGIVLGLETSQQHQIKVQGVSVLKAPGYIHKQVNTWLEEFGSTRQVHWHIEDDFHCGGYARRNAELDSFMACAAQCCPVPIEPVYTGKLALALYQHICQGEIAPGTEIIAIHTGGILPTSR